MTEYPVSRLSQFIELTDRQKAQVQALGEAPQSYGARTIIRREGEDPSTVFLLLRGWASSSQLLPDGRRQITKVHLPGDMLGTPSMCLTRAAETLTTLTAATVSRVSVVALGKLMMEEPRIAMGLFLCAQQERVALMDSLAAIGQTSALARLSGLLLCFHERLKLCGTITGDTYDLPVTQEQIADVLGLTSVHVNRTMRELDRMGVITRVGHRVTLDVAALQKISGRPNRVYVREPDWMGGKGNPQLQVA